MYYFAFTAYSKGREKEKGRGERGICVIEGEGGWGRGGWGSSVGRGL